MFSVSLYMKGLRQSEPSFGYVLTKKYCSPTSVYDICVYTVGTDTISLYYPQYGQVTRQGYNRFFFLSHCYLNNL